MMLVVVTREVSKLSGWLNASAKRNIWYMVVTRVVSKLSGWLNDDAPCQESKGGHMRGSHGARHGRQAGGGGRPPCKQRLGVFRAGLDCRLGAENREERTWNMPSMSVTLEVSKLSG